MLLLMLIIVLAVKSALYSVFKWDYGAVRHGQTSEYVDFYRFITFFVNERGPGVHISMCINLHKL